MRYRLLIVVVATTFCTVIALQGLGLRRLAAEWMALHPMTVPGVLVLYTANFLLRAARFRCLVTQPVSWGAMLSVVGVGFLAITVIPLRLGELVRPYLLAERHGVPFGAGLAAVVAERVLDLVALLVCCLVVAWGVAFPVGLRVGGVDVLAAAQTGVGAVAAVGLMAIAALALRGARVVTMLAEFFGGRRPRLGRWIQHNGEAFVAGVGVVLSRPWITVYTGVMTLLMWMFSVGGLGAMSWGVGLDHLSVGEILGAWTVTVTTAVVVPTPASMGSFEFGGVGALVGLGVERELAQTVIVALHAVTLLHTVAVGVAFLLLTGGSLRSLARASQDAAVDAATP